MSLPAARPEVIALGRNRGTLAALLRAARDAGAVGFATHDVGLARARFLERGLLDVLVIAPDTAPTVADGVSQIVWAVDPSVDILVFGRDLLRAVSRANLHRIGELHPTSRAGLGALCRHVAERRAKE